MEFLNLTDCALRIVFRCVVTSPTGTRVVGACAVLYHRGTVVINSTCVTKVSCKMSEEAEEYNSRNFIL